MWRKFFSVYDGGINFIDDYKSLSNELPLDQSPLPQQLILPLRQHIGISAIPTVKIGDYVYKGQLIAKSQSQISAPIHAAASGKILNICRLPTPQLSNQEELAIVIATDGKEHWIEHHGIPYWQQLAPQQLIPLINEAGIVGLGGAGFPSAIKINSNNPINTLIINGVECEPYITCDDLLMRNYSQDIIHGILILIHIINPQQCVIAIEDNKPEAYQAFTTAALGSGIDIVRVPSHYPSGGEKQIIQVITGKEVPSGKLPQHIGIICHNVATVYAIYRAIIHGEPLITRIITITGNAVPQPRNIIVFIGTPIAFLLDHYQIRRKQMQQLIMGGPMMGVNLIHDNFSVIKTTNCLICNTTELNIATKEYPCIRCIACVAVCPIKLLPHQLYWYARVHDLDKINNYHLNDCIECGCCAAVCPSNIPLVQYYRHAKQEINKRNLTQQKSAIARQRHEAHNARLAREQQKKAQKLAIQKNIIDHSELDQKKAIIAAALAKVTAKKII